MVFGFGEKKKDDKDQVKEAVSKKDASAMSPQGIPEHISELAYKEPMPTMDQMKEKVPDELKMAEPIPEKAKFAPLFVKIDRYREILESINRLKMAIVNIHSLIEVQNQLKSLRSQVDQEMHKEIAKMNKVVESLDTELVRPKAVEPYLMPKPSETAKMHGYVSELEGELSKLQDQLKKIEE